MKLKVGDMKAFERWKSQAISEVECSTFDIIRLLDVQKLSSIPLNIKLKEIDVSPSLTIEKVIKIATNIQGIDLAVYEIIKQSLYCLSVQAHELSPSSKLSDYDIQEGDLLLLDEDVERRWESAFDLVLYCMISRSVREVLDFCQQVKSPSELKIAPSNKDARYDTPLESILLYTEEDVDLAQYIRFNFPALDQMTGSLLNVYSIEKPTQVQGISARVYWKAALEQSTYAFFHLMGWTRYKPYDKSEIYKIANMLGIYPNALPCIVIFRHHTEIDERIVITITGEIKTFFREVCTAIHLTTSGLTQSQIEQGNFKEFKTKFLKILGTQQEKGENEKSQKTTFNFSGKTVFVHRHSGQLEIKDFQNG